jgi:hypothetical protein
VNAIHGDWVVAVHVQSRSTVIATVPVPPVEPNDVVAADTLGWHRALAVVDGAATLVVAELPHPIVTHARDPAMTSAEHVKRWEHS